MSKRRRPYRPQAGTITPWSRVQRRRRNDHQRSSECRTQKGSHSANKMPASESQRIEAQSVPHSHTGARPPDTQSSNLPWGPECQGLGRSASRSYHCFQMIQFCPPHCARAPSVYHGRARCVTRLTKDISVQGHQLFSVRIQRLTMRTAHIWK